MQYTINNLSEQELNLIINALAQLQYSQVYQLIDKFQKQIQEHHIIEQKD